MRRATFIATLAATCATAAAPAGAQTIKLSGGVFRVNHGGSDPLPISGAKVFLYAPSSERIGPSLTDGNGRFGFYDVADGTFVLRVSLPNDDRVVWQQDVRVPSYLRPIVLP